MSSAATAARSAAVCTDRSVPLGKYWRSNPLARLCRGVVGAGRGRCAARGAVHGATRRVLVREAVAQLVADLLGTPPPVQ